MWVMNQEDTAGYLWLKISHKTEIKVSPRPNQKKLHVQVY